MRAFQVLECDVWIDPDPTWVNFTHACDMYGWLGALLMAPYVGV